MVAAAGFVLLGLAPGFVLILLAAVFLAFFSTPVIPLSVSVALAAFRFFPVPTPTVSPVRGAPSDSWSRCWSFRWLSTGCSYGGD